MSLPGLYIVRLLRDELHIIQSLIHDKADCSVFLHAADLLKEAKSSSSLLLMYAPG